MGGDVGVGRIGVGVWVSVVVDDLHVESGGAFGESATDPAHTDDAEGLAFGIVGRLETGFELAKSGVDFSSVVLTQTGEDEEHGRVGSGIVDSGRGVRDGDAASLGGVNIDLIVSGSVVADGFQGFRKSLD